jgi:hypothetical protein
VSGSFSSFHVHGTAVRKNLYLFSRTHIWIFSFSALKIGQFLSATPCPLAPVCDDRNLVEKTKNKYIQCL